MIRRLTTLCLCLTLAIASVSMAIARSQPLVVGEISLCLGEGTVTVAVDARGQPVERPAGGPHLCPDCLAGLTLALAAREPEAACPLARSDRIRLTQPAPCALRHLFPPQARGPPFSV